jgi:hypothetical protein
VKWMMQQNKRMDSRCSKLLVGILGVRSCIDFVEHLGGRDYSVVQNVRGEGS